MKQGEQAKRSRFDKNMTYSDMLKQDNKWAKGNESVDSADVFFKVKWMGLEQRQQAKERVFSIGMRGQGGCEDSWFWDHPVYPVTINPPDFDKNARIISSNLEGQNTLSQIPNKQTNPE